MSAAGLWATAGRWFDGAWYLVRNPDVARAGLDPLAHYLRYGEAEGRYPSPWFDPAWYRAVYGIPAGQSPLGHFLAERHTGKRLPCPALYVVPHLPPWRDGIGAEADPFDRYLSDMLLPERELLPDLTLIQSSGLIDPAYRIINGADRYADAIEPALHYCRFGWRIGCRPNPGFDPAWYAETNPVVPRLGINPLLHYILEGEAGGRRPTPWFDPAWYHGRYEIPSGRLALAHYLAHRDERIVSPNPLFDTAWYVARHGDTIPPGIDPFSHYLSAGALRDIDPSPRFDARAWRHRHMAPLGATDQSRLPIEARNPLVHHLRHVHGGN